MGLGWTLLAMVGEAAEAGRLESSLARFADRGPSSLVLVVGRDVADPGVKTHAVVVVPDDAELGAKNGGVGDGCQVGPLGHEVAEE